MFGRHMTLLALKKPGSQNYFSLVRPNTGESYFDMEVWTCLQPAVLLGCYLNGDAWLAVQRPSWGS